MCTIDGLTINNNIGGHGPSTDGIDIDSSCNILIENCDVTLDSFRAFASEDVRERDFDALLDLACAVEVFQTGALVHDDIIDDSDLRRGKPSAHRAFSTGTHSEAIGHGLGIMLGDMLATASVDIADKAASKLTHGSDVVAALLNMHREVEVGQVLDLAVELNPLDDPDELVEASLNVFRWKTASYTTIAPLEFGMLAAGIGKDDARKQALAVGLPLGLAFQLADDLLDVVGSSSNTGKPVGGDIREGKRTVLLADAINAANDTQRRELIDMWEADSRSETQVKRAIELFEQTGAIERSRGRIADLWNESKTAIETLSLSEYICSIDTIQINNATYNDTIVYLPEPVPAPTDCCADCAPHAAVRLAVLRAVAPANNGVRNRSRAAGRYSDRRIR